jgi:hypothetical protein
VSLSSSIKILKYYNTRAGDDFHQVKILMPAPTGKAAYNIKGNNT